MSRRMGVALCLVTLIVPFLSFSAAPVAAQFPTIYDQGGVAVNFNYGSRATIGANTTPYVHSGDFTSEFVESHKAGGDQHYGFGSGWAAGVPACGAVAGNSVSVFWLEPDLWGCQPVNLGSGDNDFYNEYDGTYWCHGWEGSCYHPRTNAQVGMYGSDEVILEGMVYSDGNGDVTTMGNEGQALAIYLSNPAFKPTPSAPPYGWTTLTSSDSANIYCNPSASRYHAACAYAATVWYVYDWSTP